MLKDFPAALQPIILQGFLEREFGQALRLRATYRTCAERAPFEAAITNPLASKYFRRYENELTFPATRVGIASQLLQNAYVNGEQAAKCLNELAKQALYQVYGGEDVVMEARDILTTNTLRNATDQLLEWDAPKIDGFYNCYIDIVSTHQLFNDPDFKWVFYGTPSAAIRHGMANDFLGLRFMPVSDTASRPHPTLPGCMVRSPIICAAGAVLERTYDGMTLPEVAPPDSIINLIDNVAMVTRVTPDDMIGQSWYWIGDFIAPTVGGVGKRAVVIEHAG